MPTGTERAFELYRALPDSGMISVQGRGTIIELLVPYICSVVKARSQLPAGARRDDANSEACLVVLEAVIARQLPSGDALQFRVAVRRTVISNITKLVQHEKVRRFAESAYVQCSNGSELSAAQEVATTELVHGAGKLLAKAMLRRSRFPAVTPEVCEKVIDWHGTQQRDRGLLGAQLIEAGFWDRWFLARYVETLYRWARYDLREGLLAS